MERLKSEKMTNSLPFDGKSFKERLEEILDNLQTMTIGATSPEDIRDAREHYMQDIISLLEESIEEWMPNTKTVEADEISNEGTFRDGILVGTRKGYNQALSQTKDNFRKWLKT